MDQYSPIINKKLEIYLDRSRKTISSWLNAYILAEARVYPRRKELIDIYDYLLLDNHLKGIVRNRKNKIAGEKWHIVDEDGVTMDEESKLLRKAWFKKFIRLALDAKPYGYSLIELSDIVNGEVKKVTLIDRRNVSPERREVLIRPSDIYGISIDEPAHADNYILVDGEEGLGLLLSAAPDVIYKRYAKAAWTEHAENFSLPFLHGKTNLADEDGTSRLREELAKAGRERIMLTDHSDELATVTAGSTDAHKIYDELIDRCNSELSKLIVGQTMTTDDGSSKSQGEVHERVSDQIAKDDREFIEDLVNDHLIPKLINLGYPLDGCKFTYNLTKESTVEEKVQVFGLLLTHYDVAPDQIKETFGVDVEKKEPVDVGGKGKGLYSGAEDDKGGK